MTEWEPWMKKFQEKSDDESNKDRVKFLRHLY